MSEYNSWPRVWPYIYLQIHLGGTLDFRVKTQQQPTTIASVGAETNS